jgi:hypothetical protein
MDSRFRGNDVSCSRRRAFPRTCPRENGGSGGKRERLLVLKLTLMPRWEEGQELSVQPDQSVAQPDESLV